MILLALALLAVEAGGAPANDGYRLEVESAPMERTLFATTQSADTPSARARISGLLASRSVDEGDRVESGQVLAVVVDPELASRINAARAQVSSAQAEAVAARQELERVRTLVSRGNASRARLDEVQRRAGAAEGTLNSARGELDSLKARRSRGEVLAPVDGRVLQAPVTAGSAVNRGDTIALVASDPPLVRLAAPERHAEALSTSDELMVKLQGGWSSARIVQVFPQIRNGRIEVDIQPEGQPASDFIGARVPVRLRVGESDALIAPKRYVFTRAGLSYVYRADAGLTLVRTGRIWPDRVELLSGAKPGDVLLPPEARGE